MPHDWVKCIFDDVAAPMYCSFAALLRAAPPSVFGTLHLLSLPYVNSISGLVVEYIVAIDVTRVRFPADALLCCFVAYACTCWPTSAKMDTLGFEPRAFRMRSGCDTTTPCALDHSGANVFDEVLCIC